MFGLLSFISLLACSDSKKTVPCPPNSSGEACDCDAGFFGTIRLEDGLWQGECTSGLDMALSTGDPSYLVSEQGIIDLALKTLETSSVKRKTTLQAIFKTDSIDYAPTEWSNHIQNLDLERNFIFLAGSEDAHSLAVSGEGEAARILAFGANVISLLYNGALPTFEVHFERSLQWLITGDPDSPIEGTSVALTGVGWWIDEYRAYLTQIRPDWEVIVCDEPDQYASCSSSIDLWILGSEGSNDTAASLEEAVTTAHLAGTPILYSHTQTWAENPFGTAAISPLGMTFGEYGGNYWSADRADWEDVESALSTGGLIGDLQRLIGHLKADDYQFDFSDCTEFVGQISCEDVPGIQSEFFAGARALKAALNRFDSKGMNLFDEKGFVVWKLLVLLGDWYRSEIVYPMSKSDSDVMPFFKSYFADHAVMATRRFNPAQPDLGTFGSPDVDNIEPVNVVRDVLLSKHGGFTAAGVYALPGQPFTVRRSSESGPAAYVRINTQRTGSTREFNDDQYTRPKFLSSPYLPIPTSGDLVVTWPYGGTIQVFSRSIDADSTVSLGFDNVGEHAVLWPDTSLADYREWLDIGDYPMTELYNPYVQIHSQTSMMQEAIESYGGDLDAFFWDMETYMIVDTYNLAGFTGDGLSLNSAVASQCDSLNWNCVDEDIHGRPPLQHINVDYYAHCGGGCSGNPYDQAWPLGPLGWGETHEIGHNLQRSRLDIYGPRSSEVSNQIFPLRKHALWYEDTGESLTSERIDFQGAYEIIQNGFAQSDSSNAVYIDLWSSEGIYDNNAQRMSFYMQLVYLADQRPDFESGWDIYTLMYLHERLFSVAVDGEWSQWSEALGFSNFSLPPVDISGNDFLLLSASFLLDQDLRPLFDAWGIDFGEDASNQVNAYGLPSTELVYYAATNTNDLTSVFTLPIDGQTLWPNQ